MRAPLLALAAVLSLAACNKPATTPAAAPPPAATAPAPSAAVSSVPDALQEARRQTNQACKADRDTLCPGKRGRELGACYRDHKDQVSQACRDARANQRKVRDSLRTGGTAPAAADSSASDE